MSKPVTIEDIYELFRLSQQEADRRAAEADRRAAEAKAEADRRAAEDAQRAAEAAQRAAEADRRAAEADRRLEKLERTVENTNRAVNGLTTRWGRFVEELVRPAVVRLFRAKGIEINRTFLRMRSERPNLQMEIDIFGVNGMKAIAVECKSRLSNDDIEEMCERLGKLKQAFPEYRDYQIFGAVAAIEVDQQVGRYAYQRGLYVIKPSGDTVEIVNDDQFQAVAW
ncbi:MAG: DUF3782 domain-containing protein [Pseudanabaenaceae cyanobacterium bins.39]|nr:DUF3782 domain-containing protein [Pseudanabaenaceae cyanobacterium bins.39]